MPCPWVRRVANGVPDRDFVSRNAIVTQGNFKPPFELRFAKRATFFRAIYLARILASCPIARHGTRCVRSLRLSTGRGGQALLAEFPKDARCKAHRAREPDLRADQRAAPAL